LCCNLCCDIAESLYRDLQDAIDKCRFQYGHPDEGGKSPSYWVSRVIDKYKQQYQYREKNVGIRVLYYIEFDINGCTLVVRWKFWDRTKTQAPLSPDGNEIVIWCEGCDCKRSIKFIGD